MMQDRMRGVAAEMDGLYPMGESVPGSGKRKGPGRSRKNQAGKRRNSGRNRRRRGRHGRFRGAAVLAVVLLAVACLIAAGILFWMKRDNTDQVTEQNLLILSADKSRMVIGVEHEVTFSVESPEALNASEMIVSDENGREIVRLARQTGDGSENVLFTGTARFREDEPAQYTLTGRAGEKTTTDYVLTFVPEVTEEQITVGRDVFTDLETHMAPLENSGQAEDEELIRNAETFLKNDGRVAAVDNIDTGVLFTTYNGIQGIYFPPSDEDTLSAGSFSLNSEETAAFSGDETVYAPTAEGDTAVSWNTPEGFKTDSGHSITNSNVLVGELYYGFNEYSAFSDKRKKQFAEGGEKIANALGGYSVYHTGVEMLDDIYQGRWAEYGTVLIHTHGSYFEHYGRNFGVLQVSTNSATDQEVIRAWALSQDLRLMMYADTRGPSTAGLILANSEGEYFITTEFIKEIYQGKKFENTVFYFGACQFGKDTDFLQFLINHGAKVTFSYKEDVASLIVRLWLEKVIDFMLERSDGQSRNCVGDLKSGDLGGDFMESITITLKKYKELQLYTPDDQFTYEGYGRLGGSVMCLDRDGKLLEGQSCCVRAFRYENGQYHREAVAWTAENGSFVFDNLRWGSYVLTIGSPYGTGTKISCCFDGKDVFLKEPVVLQTEAVSDSQQTETEKGMPDVKWWDKFRAEDDQQTEEETDTGQSSSGNNPADIQSIFEEYIQTVLVPQYGVMDTGQLEGKGGYGNCNQTWNASDLSGLLCAAVRDFDSDGQEELLTVGFTTGEPDAYGDADTDLILCMYEYDSTAGVLAAAHRQMRTANGFFEGNIGYRQIGVFAYEYQGGTYIGVDTHVDANSSGSSLSVFQYGGTGIQYIYDPNTGGTAKTLVTRGGTDFSFVTGVSYEILDAGCWVKWEYAESDQPLYSYSGYASWNSIRAYEAYSYEANSAYAETNPEMTESEKADFMSAYQQLIADIGLNVNDGRIGMSSNSGWPDENYYVNNTKTSDVYAAQEGNIVFLAGMYTFCPNRMYERVLLERLDYTGSLDQYRQH
ncbi:MAG: hypothetical protein SOX32_03505 [Candidatus Choladocola sp.]|nr:hypothetical protein [Candidatus Choladocola sp.]